MKIDLEFAELHNPLFLAGTNLQMKLDPAKRSGLKLVYDRAEKELLVYFKTTKGEYMAIVPSANVSSMTPVTTQAEPTGGSSREVPFAQPASLLGKRTAQVSTPQSHVHAGEGHGETGQEKKGRPVL